jgi:hypothetical protein
MKKNEKGRKRKDKNKTEVDRVKLMQKRYMRSTTSA